MTSFIFVHEFWYLRYTFFIEVGYFGMSLISLL